MYYKKDRRGARAMVVEMERFGATEAIPPVVAGIFEGDRSSLLVRKAGLVRG